MVPASEIRIQLEPDVGLGIVAGPVQRDGTAFLVATTAARSETAADEGMIYAIQISGWS